MLFPGQAPWTPPDGASEKQEGTDAMYDLQSLAEFARRLAQMVGGRERYRPELYYLRGKASGHAPARKPARTTYLPRRIPAE